MRKFSKITLLFYCLVFCPVYVSGQNRDTVKQVIDRINGYYEKTPNFRTSVTYTLYKDHASNEIVDVDSAEMVRYNGITWLRMGKVETVSDGVYDLMVHHEDKTIVIANNNKGVAPPIPHGALDSLLASCNYFNQDTYGDVGCFYLGFEQNEAKGISICYHLADHSLFSLTTYYQNEQKISDEQGTHLIKPRLEIRYIKTDTTFRIDTSKIKHNWFVRQAGNTFKPTDRFKGYQIFNQIIK